MNVTFRVISVVLLLLLSAALAAKQSNWVFENREGPPIFVRMYIPGDVGPETKIVIVMHGADHDNAKMAPTAAAIAAD